jgi:uncharacterized protein with NAD-binding domain and iron-sulfur cluster
VTAPESPQSKAKTKVAILGGGCGGLAAAWGLTASPALRERFDVSVYELSWALGGKGASGRMPHPIGAGDGGQRIHEHGLHIWFGFYEHAFRMLRGAYEESRLAAGEDWWKGAFEKVDGVSLYEQRGDGTWVRQPIHLPRRGGAQRGPPTRPRRIPIGEVVVRTIRLLATAIRTDLGVTGSRRRGPGRWPGDPGVAAVASTLDRIAVEVGHADCAIALGTDEALRSAARGRVLVGERPRRLRMAGALEQLLVDLSADVRDLGNQLGTEGARDRVRLWRGVLELVAASLKGIVRDDVLTRGLGALDDEDLREWLGRHGASEETLARSPVLRGLYDLTFAYRGGDKRHPSLAAGKGLQSLLMMINYEGSFMWRMRAGMGDVVFAPLYMALRERGVTFHFFSEVTNLRLAPGRPVIEAIELTRNATVSSGHDDYEPLEQIGDWWCWPAAPRRDQLANQTARHVTLKRLTDFDVVVLAIPVGALSNICGELAAADPRFKLMLDRAETVRTKSLQLWLTKPIAQLRGSTAESGPDPPATAYAEPFDTYCDMSQVLAAEDYGAGARPKGVAYFCAVLPDAESPIDAERAVRASALQFLENNAKLIWPEAVQNGSFDWSVLFDPQARAGKARLEAQYCRANVAASDRYVTTPAGSVDARLHPGQSGFENLALAGDWTHSGIDGGCVEAAVVSGERAAEAIIGRDRQGAPGRSQQVSYVEYGALATAPGPLRCERARIYCFLLQTDRARVQQLCDRVFKEPTGGARRYFVPRLSRLILTFGTIAGLRSLHPAHADRGTASEPEAAIWVPTIAQRYDQGRYVDEHLAIFMPYLWVDDPIALASGREVYGYPKTQGWMKRLTDPRQDDGSRPPDPPDPLVLDVYGAVEYSPGSELSRQRLITISRRGVRRRSSAGDGPQSLAEGSDLASLGAHFISELEPSSDAGFAQPSRRSPGRGSLGRRRRSTIAELLTKGVVQQVFLKQVRDAQRGELAALQQVVEARSSVSPGSLRWRQLRGSYELSVNQLDSHPLEDELGVTAQTIRLAFVAEFGFRMDPGLVRWAAG